MEITLTVLQRLKIEAYMKAQEAKDPVDMMVRYQLLLKIRIPKSERGKYVREMGQFAKLLETPIEQAEPATFELEKAEWDELRDFLKSQGGVKLALEDMEWWLPLKEQYNL